MTSSSKVIALISERVDAYLPKETQICYGLLGVMLFLSVLLTFLLYSSSRYLCIFSKALFFGCFLNPLQEFFIIFNKSGYGETHSSIDSP